MSEQPEQMPSQPESSAEDRALGMNRRIPRRDFLNGMAVTAAAIAAQTMLPWGRASAGGAGGPPVNYPPRQTGLAGQTDASNAIMHAVRDGVLPIPAGQSTGETFDLVVVGAGISGLSAALEFRRHQPNARILLLDPLPDVGGHATRNEFTVGGRKLIGYGGSQSLQTPSYFSPAVTDLLTRIGIEPEKFEGYYDGEWFDKRGLGEGVYFDPKVWGKAATVKIDEENSDWVNETPLSAKAKQDLIGLLDAPKDYLAGKTAAEKRAYLASVSYRHYLLNDAKVQVQVADFVQDNTREYFGAGADVVGALDAFGNGQPGFDGLALGEGVDRTMSPSARLTMTDPDDYIYHFPDGNASVARALVRALIPAALSGKDMVSLALTNLNYAALDGKSQPVRIRLNSSVVKVRHLGDPSSAGQVEVSYADANGFHSVVAGNVVLACWHRVIPYLTKELPAAQVTALQDQVKIPLVYTNVAIRNYRAWQKLGLSSIDAPGSFWLGAELDFPVSMGTYQFAQKADDPVVLHLRTIPRGQTGADARTQFNQGRRRMMEWQFSDYEREIRRMLQTALGGGGFDAARDIAAITVNRWAHGYSYEYMRPTDPYWPGGPLPIETARRGWGRVAIANADSGAYAYAHSAIDQGIRAARELLGVTGGPAVSPFPGPPEEKLEFDGGGR